MKYIDSEKLIAEIERRIEETKSMKPAFDQFWAGQISAFKGVIKIIDSLQQGQPSLPSNLDEAAEETAKKYYCSCLEKHNETGICDGCENVKLTFKAGAEWMAGQGETVEGYIAGVNDVAAILAIPRKEHNKGDKVVVQIRKKQ